MLLARALTSDLADDLSLGFDRLGLPAGAREYLFDKISHLHVLLTGLLPDDARMLRALAEREGEWAEEFPRWIAGDPRTRAGCGIVSGRREQVERLVVACRQRERPGLAVALERLLASLDATPKPMRLGRHLLSFGGRPLMMGVLNVTPDSFSDGGRFLAAEDAIAQGEALVAAGAELLDVGGESTRPGALPVPVQDQIARVVPVIRALSQRVDVPLSIDTTRSEVARVALRAGATLVNDVSGFTFDPVLPRVIADAGAGCCAMHLLGTPATMQVDPRYDDVVAEVVAFLDGAVARAVDAGVHPDQVMVDPGIGFGKTVGHNLTLLRRAKDLRVLGRPVLIGTSRKSPLGALTGKPAAERVVASAASVAVLAAMGAADVVRVHDVAETKDALTVAHAIRLAAEGGDAFTRKPAR
jgi:dihydropteroate synthase